MSTLAQIEHFKQLARKLISETPGLYQCKFQITDVPLVDFYSVAKDVGQKPEINEDCLHICFGDEYCSIYVCSVKIIVRYEVGAA